MAVARDKPIKQGHLLIPPAPKKKWQKKYCVLYKFSTHGKERLEIYDSEDDAAKRSSSKHGTIILDNCDKISLDPQKNQPNAFSVITKNDRHFFAGITLEDSADWVITLQGVAFPDSFSNATIEEDNELYCPSGDAGVYSVMLVSTEASQRCGLSSGDYTLVVAAEELQIRNRDTQSLLFIWPYRCIRRYGLSRSKIYFDAGRKCASGEGRFDLDHSKAQEIYNCMTSKMESMKQQLGNKNSITATNSMSTNMTSTLATSNSSISTFLSPGSSDFVGLPIDDGLNAAWDLSPRSRSPLVSVPSPSIHHTRVSVPTVASAPMKPPRKPIAPAPVPRYDPVEVRTDAWRTHGTDAVHAERHAPDRVVPPEHRTLPAAVFQTPDTHADYDTLNHLGPTPKLDEDPSYSTINRTDTTGHNQTDTTGHNRTNTTGHGSTRKPVISPRHQVYNDSEYIPMFNKLRIHQPSHKV